MGSWLDAINSIAGGNKPKNKKQAKPKQDLWTQLFGPLFGDSASQQAKRKARQQQIERERRDLQHRKPQGSLFRTAPGGGNGPRRGKGNPLFRSNSGQGLPPRTSLIRRIDPDSLSEEAKRADREFRKKK